MYRSPACVQRQAPQQRKAPAEADPSNRLRQRPFLLSHARIVRDEGEGHLAPAFPTTAAAISPARAPASAVTSPTGQPAVARVASNLGTGSSVTCGTGAAEGATAAAPHTPERSRNVGAPGTRAPALVTELRRLASLRRIAGAQAAPASRPLKNSGSPGQLTSACRQPQAQPDRLGRQRSSHNCADQGRTDVSSGSTLAAELRALRARPPRKDVPDPAVVPRAGRSLVRGQSGGVAEASQVMRDPSDRAAHVSSRASVQDAGTLGLRAAPGSAGCRPKAADVQEQEGTAFAAAQVAPAHSAVQEPALAPACVFDGIRAIFDPSLEPSEAARWASMQPSSPRLRRC